MRRLDLELTKRGLARSRTEAKELIESGLVLVNGFVAVKPTNQVDENASISLAKPVSHYVSRGATKLLSALKKIDIDFKNKVCLDAGASTGGFSQVMLESGAKQIYAVDVGYGQLAWSLRQDPRVVVIDRTNIKDLAAQDFDLPVDIITADLSFISLKSVLPALDRIISTNGEMLLMVKPQFEVGKDAVGRGVVRDAQLRRSAILDVIATARNLGWVTVDAVESEVHGPSGNREFFIHLRQNGAELSPEMISALVSEDM